MLILWKYFKEQKWWVLLSLLLAGCAQLLSLIDPLIFGKIIDDYTIKSQHLSQDQKIEGVLFWLGIAIVIAIIARVLKAFQEYFTRLAVQQFGMKIFNDGLRQTLRLDFSEFEDQRSGETLSVLQKVKTDTERFVNTFITVLFSSVVGIGFLIWYSVTKNSLLVPVFIFGILFLGIITSWLSTRIKTVQRSINRETNKMSGVITESLRNIELVKSLGLTFQEIKRLKIQTHNIYDLEMLKTRQVRKLAFFQGTTLNILKQAILFILLWLIFKNELSTGELISMQFISTSIFVPLQDLGNIILSFREVEASLLNFDSLMQKPIERKPEAPIEIGPIKSIKFKEVIFRYKTASTNAIDKITFEANAGETIAFVGPSGSGKSSLVKLLVGLYKPIEGDILFNNVPSTQIRFNEMRRQIGFVTQDTHLFAGSIRENLLFVKEDAKEEELYQALKKASCTDLISRAEKGIDTLLGEGGIKLSGGEKQRISIARALLRNPRLLIFDEATSALDSITEEDITNTIKDVSETKEQTTILIAHRLSTIMHANVIYVLEKGKVSETGTHETLLEKKGLYYAMWRQQVGERR